MNQSYRLVWSVVRSAWTVVSELAKSHAKSGAAMVTVAAVTAALPAHGAGTVSATGGNTVTVVSDTYTVGNGVYGITASNGNILFDQGGIFNINSTDTAALSATNNGTMVELGNGGGTYKINTGVGSFYAIEARSGGKIDLSKAASVELTTGHAVGVWADQANSKIDISKLTLNQTGTGTTGYGIQASALGQITIGELNLTTNQTGVKVNGLNPTVTIGNATTKSSINSTGIGVLASSSGSVSLTNTDITSTGIGVLANSGSVTLTDVSIATSGDNGAAIRTDSNTTTNFAGTNTISTTGANAAGLLLYKGSKITGEYTGTITTGGSDAIGIDSAAANLALKNANITTTGQYSHAIMLTEGTTTITGGSVTTGKLGEDSRSTGVNTRSTGSSGDINLSISGTKIETLGLSSEGVSLNNKVTTGSLKDVNIITRGDSSRGLSSSVRDLNVSNTIIETTGSSSTGIAIGVGGPDPAFKMTITGGSVTTRGSRSDAMVFGSGSASGQNISIDISGGTKIKTFSDNSRGLYLGGTTNVKLDDVTIETRGKSSLGIYSVAATFEAVNTTVTTAEVASTGMILNRGTNTIKGGLVTTGVLGVASSASGIAVSGTGLLPFETATSIDISGGTRIITKGNSSIGLSASGSVKGSIQDVFITTYGNNSDGIFSSAPSYDVNGNPIYLTTTNAEIKTEGTSSSGISISGGSQLVISGGLIETGGTYAHGITAGGGTNGFGNDTFVKASGIKITTKNQDSHGVDLGSGGTVGKLNDLTITTTGKNSNGIKSYASTLDVVNTTITTTESGSTGMILNRGTNTIKGGLVTTGVLGVASNANGVEVTATGTSVDISGGTKITTLGNSSNGIKLGAGTTGTVSDTDIITNGTDSVGINVAGASTVNFGGTNNINTAGANSTALLVGAGATVTGTFIGSVVAQNADAIVLNDTTANTKTLALQNATVNSPSNAILLKKGDLAVTATDSIMTGDIQAETGAVLDLTMVGTDKAVSVLTGAILNARDVVIDPSTWNITANSDAVNLTNDASDFRFVNADGTAPTAAYSDFKTVTVNTYTGSKAANLYLNTRLNGDDVTGTYSDKIVVRDGGTMSGDTTFHFANAGGTGAATYDGIKFVDAQGTATVDKSNFKIAGGYVAAGAYGYVGRQGQYTNLADNQSLFLTNFAPKGSEVDGNGFLNGGEGVVPPKPTEVPSGTGTGTGGNFSENPADGTSGNSHIDKDGNSVCDNDSTLAGCAWPPTPIDPVDPVDPVDPDNIKPTTDPVKPKRLISPDFVTYNAAADVVSLSANTLLGTYHERMGAQNTPLIQAETSTSVNTNSWGRLVADTREVAYDNAAFNQSIQGETMGFQLGHSFWQSRNKDNALGQAGVAVGYVTGSMDVTGDFLTTQQGDAGSVDAQTTSLMAYYTLAANDGRYLDAVLQYSMSSADAQGKLSNLSLDATGLRASLEVGKPVRLDSLTLEPQAQLIAYKDSFDDAADSNGYVMSQADNSGVIFRVGARLTSNDTTAAFKPWFAANINLQNGSTTGITDKTNNVYESSEKDAKWADMSVGMSYQTSSDFSVYGHLKQSVAIGGGTNTTTSGAIGIQKAW